MALHPALRALLDVPPADLPSLVTGGSLVRSALVDDTDLPDARGQSTPLTVVLTGGATQLTGPASWCERAGVRLLAVRTALRDLEDLTGNARRVVAAVDAARAEGALAEETAVHVVLPATETTYSWLAAADELAAAELGLALPVEGAVPEAVAAWLAAALDREMPFTCTGGTGRATGGPGSPGFLDLLEATLRCFDGGTTAEVIEALAAPTPRPGAPLDLDELARVRRWLVGVDAADPVGAQDDLTALGLPG